MKKSALIREVMRIAIGKVMIPWGSINKNIKVSPANSEIKLAKIK